MKVSFNPLERWFSSCILVLACALGSLSLAAQPIWNVKVGLHGNAISTELDGSSIEGKTGWQLGMDARIWGGTFYAQPGVFYQLSPLEFRRRLGGQDPVEVEADNNLQQLRIPLLLGVRLSNDPLIFAWHLRAGVEGIWTFGTTEDEVLGIALEDIHDWVPAARMELGLDILFLTLDAGYSFALTDTFTDASGRNHGFLVALGFSF